MLMRVRYSPTLALTIAQFSGLIEADDFYMLRDVLAGEHGPTRPADQMLLFDAEPRFAPSARRAFRSHIESVASVEQMPLAISCALVSEAPPPQKALRDWLESIQPSERLRAAVDMFGSWRAAAQWIGLDEYGLQAIQDMSAFRTLYEAPPQI